MTDQTKDAGKPEAVELEEDQLDKAAGGLKAVADPDDGGEYAPSTTTKRR
ncbi:MAG: hypothetical protein IPN84_10355 [Sphingomonadales bacterium]|jgi:hypothetical protein|nr:hypothetical protein [Sphingomonadales bacterium]